MAEGEKIGAAYVEITADTKAVEQALEGVKLAITAADDRLTKLDAEWRSGSIAADKYYAETAKVSGKLQELIAQEQGLTAQLKAHAQAAQQVAGASTTATVRIDAGMKGVEQSARGAGGGMRSLVYTLDDLQYVGEMGLRPIVNNLMMVNPALGLAAMGADQLTRHWSTFVDAAQGTAVGDAMKSLDDWWQRITESAQAAAGAQQAAAIAGGAKAGQAGMAAIIDPATRGRMEAFRAAVEGEEGGGKAVMRRLVEQETKKYTPKQLEEMVNDPNDPTKKVAQRELIARDIQHLANRALEGDSGAQDIVMGRMGAAFRNRYENNTPAEKERGKRLEDLKKLERREAEDHNEKLRRDREKAAQEAARQMRDNLSAEALQGGVVNQYRVFEELSKVMPASQAHELSPLVHKDLTKEFDREMAKRKLGGMTDEEARADFLADIQERKDRDEAHKRPADRAREKEEREAKASLDKDVASLTPTMDAALEMMARQGANRQQLHDYATRAVMLQMGRGADERDARAVASQIVPKVMRDVTGREFEARTFGVNAGLPKGLPAAARRKMAARPKRSGRAAAAARPRAGATHHAAADTGRMSKTSETIAANTAKTNELLKDVAGALDTLASI